MQPAAPCPCPASTHGPPPQPPRHLQDASSQLLWWSAVVCDPSLSEPGPKEVAGQEPARYWPRDRSVRVPWPVVRAVLEEAVALRGDRWGGWARGWSDRAACCGMHACMRAHMPARIRPPQPTTHSPPPTAAFTQAALLG